MPSDTVPPADREVLRALAGEIAAIAALPVQRERTELWRRLNRLQPVRPLVWINEIPWHEMNVDDELTPRCAEPWCRGLETGMRMLLYQWRHMPGDMVVSDYLDSPLAIRSTGLGIDEDVDVVRTDPASGVVSRHYHRQIAEPEDICKIKVPQVTHDEQASQANYEKMVALFGDILPVRKVGRKGTWFAPWDFLIRLWGVEEAMLDMVDRPRMVNDAMSHLVDCYLAELDQWEALNLLTPNNDNTRVGSGGYGCTDELPPADFDPARVRAKDLWGCATAQIFSEVSPEMHWEFALRHEMRWLERWGLTYYGCCEPLDGKMDILRRIPNLRKVSMSPKARPERGAEALGERYVYSCKPNPAILAENTWRPGQARKELRETLEKIRGCRVEIIMKDISTVRYQPQRLWEWSRIAVELAEEFAP